MRTKLLHRLAVLALWLATLTTGRAQATGGTIEGRVHNLATGTYVNNARVTVEGTTAEAFTNQEGEYRLAHVPAGPAVLKVTYAGFESQTASVAVTPGQVIQQRFDLGLARGPAASAKDIVAMDAYVVDAKELSAQAIGINEQRYAPNIKNVVAFEEFGNLSDGNIGAAGRLIPVTTNALAAAQLQFQERGAEAKRTYSGFYPSFNASYAFSDAFVARAAFARTIGRPALSEIIPGATITDPDSPAATRTITVVNTGLKPWTSNNYDLSLEAYNVKGAVISASVFRKDIKDFFGQSRVPATAALLQEFGLSDDYLDYEVITKINFGEATITGIELSWRQALFFLPDWAQGFQAYGNVTRLRRSGANAADFSSFSPLNANGGFSYLRKKIAVKLNVAYAGEIKGGRIAASASVPPETFQNIAPKTTVDVYGEYRLLKRLSLYTSISNLTGEPKRTYRYAPTTPDYAKPFRYQDFGTLVTVGVRMDF